MSELQFAKQFLNTLDDKPTKYPADHVFDPKTFPMRVPYTLPKLSHPPHPLPPKSTPATAHPPGSESATATISISLQSARNPAMSLTLDGVNPATTTIQSLKEQIQSHLGGPSVVNVDKIKVLLNKKPIPPSKRMVADMLGEKASNLDLGVMVMGGAPDPPLPAPAQVQPQPREPAGGQPLAAASKGEQGPVEATESEVTPMEGLEKAAAEVSGTDVLESTQFWDDLQGFLEQRIQDPHEALSLRGLFERAWRSGSAAP